MMKEAGIAYAMTRSDLLAGRITESPIQNQVRRSFHPERSGNIHMVPEHCWFLHSTEEAEKMGIEKIAAIVKLESIHSIITAHTGSYLVNATVDW